MFKKLWIWSTVIFLLQVVVGGAVYWYSNDVVTAAFIATFAAGFVAFFAAATFASLAVAFAALAATVAAIVVVSAVALPTAFVVISVMVTLAAVALAVVAADEEEGHDSFVCRFIAMLPGGIGTVFGGLILLAQWVKAKRSVKAETR